MSKRNPQYTDVFRASAILLLEAAGWPNTKGALTRAAKHLRIPRQTLQRWAHETRNPPPPELVTVKRMEITELLDAIIYGAASEVKRRIDANELDETTTPQLMTTAAIAIDKKQLLINAPTANINHMGGAISDEERRERMKELAVAIAREIHGQ